MKISVPVLLFLTVPFCVTSTPAKIMGHYIGESVSDFRAAEGIDQKLSACKISDAKSVSPYRISQMSEEEFRAFQQTAPASGYKNLSRKKAEHLAASGELNTPESRSADQKAECKMLADTFENGKRRSYTKNAEVTYSFDGTKVSEISVGLRRSSFDEAEAASNRTLGRSARSKRSGDVQRDRR